MSTEKEAINVMLNIFRSVAEFKNIRLEDDLNSFDDVPITVVDALRDLAKSATEDINLGHYNGLGLRTIEDLTHDYSLEYLQDLFVSCAKADLKHDYFTYLAGLYIIKKYID